MERWPEFVTEPEEAEARRSDALQALTGWETVIFEVEDYDPLDSSTAAFAP